MDRYISGVNMITGLGVMDPSTDRRHTGWYEADVADKEIEQLKKENEWLAEELIELYERYTTTDMPKEEMKKMLFEEMKQALKEK